MSSERARAIVSKLKVIRPYGSIGPLEWTNEGVAFGEVDEHCDFSELTKRIKTYSEEAAPPELLIQTKSAITASSTVIVLGIGFHAPTLNVLRSEPGPGRALFATTLGLHPQVVGTIREQLRQHFLKRHPKRSACAGSTGGPRAVFVGKTIPVTWRRYGRWSNRIRFKIVKELRLLRFGFAELGCYGIGH